MYLLCTKLLLSMQVERLLEAMGSISDVEVTFSDLSSDAAPACSASGENVMSIEFVQDFGVLPAARVDGSRLMLGGSPYSGFTSTGSGASLSMVSEYEVTCSSGADDGVIYFLYDDAPSQVNLQSFLPLLHTHGLHVNHNRQCATTRTRTQFGKL